MLQEVAITPLLAQLEKVDVRHVWGNEATSFTPWLADNLELLSDTIGMVLQLESAEKSVGMFRADLLAKEQVTNTWVLIENQLERTDHSHLGQLITYASGLKAVTVVWIATEFTEEHRSAIDWLNEITDTSVRFFGLELELWKIENSPYAPKFNVVAKPNDWQRVSASYAKTVTISNNVRQQRARLFFQRNSQPINLETLEVRTVTIEEAANILGCQGKHVRTLINRGKLKTASRNRELVIVSSLKEYMLIKQVSIQKPQDTEETETAVD